MLSFNEKMTSVDTIIGNDDNGKSFLETLVDENSINPAVLLTDENLSKHIETFLLRLTDLLLYEELSLKNFDIKNVYNKLTN